MHVQPERDKAYGEAGDGASAAREDYNEVRVSEHDQVFAIAISAGHIKAIIVLIPFQTVEWHVSKCWQSCDPDLLDFAQVRTITLARHRRDKVVTGSS